MVRESKLAAVLAGLLMLASPLVATEAGAQSDRNYMGQIILEPTCPSWTLEADGRKLPIQAHAAMYSLFGTSFGGDGTKDFALPDLRGKAGVAGYRYCVVNGGRYPTRD